DATNTGLGLSLSVDLMKNLFGKLSRSQLKNAELLTKKAVLEKEIQSKAFIQNIRKIYWSLVATEEQIRISQGLLNSAQEQLKDTERRRRSNVADDGDVARSRSQVASRRANILLLEYQRESQLQQLKELVPNIAGKQVEIPRVDLNQAVVDVLSCTTVIQAHKQTPYNFTQYDEVLGLLQEAYQEQKRVINSTNNW